MSQIGSVYGQALYGLAKEEGESRGILAQLQALEEGFSQEPGYLRLLSSPQLPKQERTQILDEGFRGKVHPYVLNFLKLLTERNLAGAFPDCVREYRARYHEDNGILPVRAVTAVALTPEQSKRLEEKLAKITGKTIELVNRVDPECLGGVRLDYDGRRVEDTVAGRLESVRALLKNTVL